MKSLIRIFRRRAGQKGSCKAAGFKGCIVHAGGPSFLSFGCVLFTVNTDVDHPNHGSHTLNTLRILQSLLSHLELSTSNDFTFAQGAHSSTTAEFIPLCIRVYDVRPCLYRLAPTFHLCTFLNTRIPFLDKTCRRSTETSPAIANCGIALHFQSRRLAVYRCPCKFPSSLI